MQRLERKIIGNVTHNLVASRPLHFESIHVPYPSAHPQDHLWMETGSFPNRFFFGTGHNPRNVRYLRRENSRHALFINVVVYPRRSHSSQLGNLSFLCSIISLSFHLPRSFV
ncbi:hypothetical protein AVEN_173592-1 [Araneus ventricosus]|uniref:Uncharacterized protein n=1 Tax=Araneus ventricosus TaxID=182803 RepID=A0A4Y2CSD2_ARAVE|nr:hypothetical protein AVEN_173592-1 [Araneus ventricosus]